MAERTYPAEMILHAVPSAGLTTVLLTPDGTQLYTAGQDGPILVWDVATRRIVRRIVTRSGRAEFLALAPGGQMLAAACPGGVELWDPEQAVWLGTLPRVEGPLAFQDGPDTLVAHENRECWVVLDVESGAELRRIGWGERLDTYPYVLALSADGGTAVVSDIPDRRHEVECWDLRQGKRLPVPDSVELSSSSRGLALSPDGRGLVFSTGHDLQFVDLHTGKVQPLLLRDGVTAAHAGSHVVRASAFSGDGRALVAVPDRGRARAWWLTERLTLPGPRLAGCVTSVSVSEDGLCAAAAGKNGQVCLWNPGLGEPFAELPYSRHEVTGLDFSPDGTRIAVGLQDGTVRIWSLRTAGLAQTLLGPHTVYGKPVFSADGELLSIGTGPEAPTWELATGRLLCAGVPPPSTMPGWPFPPLPVTSPDGRWEARALPGSSDPRENAPSIALHRGGSEEPIHRLISPRGQHHPYALAFSPDSRVLLSTDVDHGMYFWNVETGECLRWVYTDHDANGSASFSPDGMLLATGSDSEGSVQLWSAETGEALERLESHATGTRGLAFSPDGQWLAGGGADGSVRLWKVERRKLWVTFRMLPFGDEAITEEWLTTTRGRHYHGSPGVERRLLLSKDGELFPGETLAPQLRQPQRIASLLGFGEEDESTALVGEQKSLRQPPPAWVRFRGEARLMATPHQARLQVGEPLRFDVILWNRSEETVWVERSMRWGLHLWIHIQNEAGEDVDFPRIKLKTAPPTSRDHFMQLPPRMCVAEHDVTGDEITLPRPGWYTVTVEHGRYVSHLCAACFGIALADIKLAVFQVYVEAPQ